MQAASLLVAMLAQVPVTVPSAGPPISPPAREWVLGGVFVLKQEQFLRWQPVLNLTTGWHTALRATWLIELSPYAPGRKHLQAFSLAIESTPASGAAHEVGIVRPRLQYQPPNSQTKVAVELPIAAFHSAGWSGAWQVFRPRLVVSGRF
jgi:hypothetical protein